MPSSTKVNPDEAGLIASYIGLLCLATTIIYAGAWSSCPKAPKKEDAKSSPFEDSDDEDAEDDSERVSKGDAYLFPIIGSAVLGGFYLIFKYFGKEWINWLLGIYFSFAGIGSVWKTSISFSRYIAGEERWKNFDKVRFLVLKRSREITSLTVRTPSLFLLLPSIIPSLLYYTSWVSPRPALLSNILAVSFAHSALSLLKLDGFKTGCILLAGLFVYDIWWVFGTDVMVSVATGLDVPIKLLWPKSVIFSPSPGFTMLGLGDIVIPGAFITLALRYDLSRSPKRDPAMSFSKPYFNAAMSSYVLGLCTTMFVMHVFKAAQPALLYLSPACIASFLITAGRKGELKECLEWTDVPPPTAKPEAGILEPKYSASDNDSSLSTKEVDNGTGLSSSKTGDDFVNVEAEDEGEGEEASKPRSKRGKNKKKKA